MISKTKILDELQKEIGVSEKTLEEHGGIFYEDDCSKIIEPLNNDHSAYRINCHSLNANRFEGIMEYRDISDTKEMYMVSKLLVSYILERKLTRKENYIVRDAVTLYELRDGHEGAFIDAVAENNQKYYFEPSCIALYLMTSNSAPFFEKLIEEFYKTKKLEKIINISKKYIN